MQRKILCEQANQMDLVDFLENLGYIPTRVRNNDYWYLSPLRQEKTASFKVNRKMNVWYDHAQGKGGTLVDFGIMYFRCSVKELLFKLAEQKGPMVSFHPPPLLSAGEKKETGNQAGKIQVINCKEIKDFMLQKYLQERQIPLTIANQYCLEVIFELYGRNHRAIGFKNDNGGFELRNHYFKGSSTPKEPRLIKENGGENLVVFEGFFSFLSFKTLQLTENKFTIELPIIQTDSLVLNSLSFFEKSREMMEQYPNIYLFLDLDQMGIKCAQKALQWSNKYQDQSKHYGRVKDLNEFLIQAISPGLKQSIRQGRHL